MSETFYGQFYRLNSAPFHITPDTSLLLATTTHKQALGVIEYGIAAGKGFIIVTGEVGVGKTTVLRAVLGRLNFLSTRIIYLFNPDLSVAELYIAILQGLGQKKSSSIDPTKNLTKIQNLLIELDKQGIMVVLAVDEAQNMPEITLEHLRVLSNIETTRSKLLQIILVGQPELDVILSRHRMRQLAQRVAVRAKVTPLSIRESCRYIRHRLSLAGRPDKPALFSRLALWYIAFKARGIPRTLNIYCDNALINGYGHRASRLSLRIVYEALGPLRPPGHSTRNVLFWSAPVVLLAVFFAGSYFGDGMRLGLGRPKPIHVAGRSADITQSPRVPTAAAAPSSAATKPVSAVPAMPASPASAATSTVQTDASLASSSTDRGTPGPISSAAGGSQPAAEIPNTNSSGDQLWLVRNGDTLMRACRAAYARCGPDQLRTILALNPKIRSQNIIRSGDIILLPAPITHAEDSKSPGVPNL